MKPDKGNCDASKRTEIKNCHKHKGYPDPSKLPLEVSPTLTFLNLGDFNPSEKTVTVFVSLRTDWDDSRLSINSTE